MPTPVLVDTSVWVDYLRGRSSFAAETLDLWLRDDPMRVLINEVVTTELLRGVRDDSSATQLGNLLDDARQAEPIVRADWLVSAHVYRACRAAGFTIRSAFDCLLAAHALRLGVPILTADRDFDPIARCCALQIWTANS